MFTKAFWVASIERAIKSAAQVTILVLGQDVTGVDLCSVDLANGASFAGGGFVLSVLTSIVSAQVGPKDSPSLVD